MKLQRIQEIKQNKDDYSAEVVDKLKKLYGLTDEELENSKLLGLSERELYFGITGIDKPVVPREMLSNRSQILTEIARIESENIDQNESRAIRLANELGLFDQKTAATLYQKSLEEDFDPKMKSSIVELQTALKEDGKYNDTLDGIPGSNTMKALSDLILENTPALIKDSKKLDLDNFTDPIQKLNKEGFQR